MVSRSLQTGSLVLYKIRPARVTAVSDKIDIELEGGKTKRVRDKDVTLLHPGPLARLSELGERHAEVEETWELLAGEQTNLQELAELLFGEFTPSSAWSAWEIVADGLWFEGEPDALHGRDAEAVHSEREQREAKAREQEEWDGFIQRLAKGDIIDEDRKRLSEVERLALYKVASSRIMQALGHAETSEHAHRLLVSCGYWDAEHNPHPGRLSVATVSPELPLPELPEEERRDLTHLPAYAIDDVGSNDPDDAISLEGERLWVHVADVAALVTPDSELDREARSRGANLYLPEGLVHMLPESLTHRLALGLQEVSPALSFGFRLGEDGSLQDIEITPSLIRVTRLSYDEADLCLHEEPFAGLRAITDRFRARREAADAARIDLPEASVKLIDGEVVIRPLPRLDARQMVTDAMLMAGEAVALYALEQGLAMPFASQSPPEEVRQPATYSEMYAYRRQFKPSQVKTEPEHHFGLGLPKYTRATSPLRRYQDLLAHQQLRAHLLGGTPLDQATLAERLAESEVGSGAIRRTERVSNIHWKLVYLKRHADWQGEAVVVEHGERKSALLIPELAFETRLRLRDQPPLDSRVKLAVREVDIPGQSAYFRVLD